MSAYQRPSWPASRTPQGRARYAKSPANVTHVVSSRLSSSPVEEVDLAKEYSPLFPAKLQPHVRIWFRPSSCSHSSKICLKEEFACAGIANGIIDPREARLGGQTGAMEATGSPRMIGDRFWLLKRPAIKGGSALVFCGRDSETDATVAVKLYQSAVADEALLNEFFNREREALTALTHPNIVRLVDAGLDSSQQKYYVVLEWLAETLSERVGREPFAGWDDFASDVLLPLLRGLAYAHNAHVYHRDIKPGNILLDEAGIPKLADFGISKMVGSLRLGLTVSDFGSQLFSAPERTVGRFDQRSDLFSLGVAALVALLPRDYLLDQSNLAVSIRDADVPPAAEEFLARMVDLDPDRRFQASAIALAELEGLQRKRPSDDRSRHDLYISLTERARSRILIGPGQREARPEKQFTEDIAQEAAIEYASERPGEANRGIDVHGEICTYRLVWDAVDRLRLKVVDVISQTPVRMDELKARSFPVSVKVIFGEIHDREAAEGARERLLDALESHNHDRLLGREQERQRDLFRGWRRVLKFKERIEKEQERPIPYRSVHEQGRHDLVIELDREPDVDLQSAQCEIPVTDRSSVLGTVTRVSGTTVSMAVARGSADDLPLRGVLRLYRWPSIQALNRQFDALDAVEFNRAARPRLRELLIDPGLVSIPDLASVPAIVFRQPDLDEAKQRAVMVALSSPDITVVEGPPGTGKTKMIAELICQYKCLHPNHRVLLTGQTHVSVDHAIAKLSQIAPELRVVRAGSEERVGEEAAGLTVANRLRAWSKEVQSNARAFSDDVAKQMGVTKGDIETLGIHEEARSIASHIDALASHRVELEKEQLELEERLTNPFAKAVPDEFEFRLSQVVEELSVASTRVAQLQGRLRDLLLRLVKALRLPKSATFLDIEKEMAHRVPNVAAANDWRELRAFQEEWIQRFGTDPGFEQALLSTADVVAATCVGLAGVRSLNEVEFNLVVVDEASKATPTETLLPLSRGKRWVLVGDRRQLPPFVASVLEEDRDALEGAGINESELRTTLFDRLTALLPENNRILLDTQHRMVVPVGKLVSVCFYDGQLHTARDSEVRKSVSLALPATVTWMSTDAEPVARRSEQKQGLSYVNLLEAQKIREWLTKFDFWSEKAGDSTSVCVLAGYSAQVNELRRIIRPNSGEWKRIRVDVASVDAFQGQERDVAVYSVVRPNDRGEIGFLASEARLNVAVSRGRDALVIFGDSNHVKRATQARNPLRTLLDHIEDSDGECVLTREL